MKGIIIEKNGTIFENKLVTNLSKPRPENNEILVEIYYSGLNFADLMMRNGTYPHPKGYPLAAGIEFSGIVVECGSGVKSISVGDRVAGFSEGAGAFSEFICIEESLVVELHKDLKLEDGAAYFVQTSTAYHLLHTISDITKNSFVLIHAIGGGVGLNLVQLAKIAGATVFGTVGTAGKEQKALDCGADLVINRNEKDFVKEVSQDFGKNCIELAIDSTGAEVLDKTFMLMKNLGHIVSYGEASGPPYSNLWSRLVSKSLTFSRLHIGHIDSESTAWKQVHKYLQGLIIQNKLRLFIEKILPLENFHTAYQNLESRKVSGKILLKLK